MTAPGGDAIFRLKWEQENARVPEQARTQLVGLAAAQRTLSQTSSAGAAVMSTYARSATQGATALQGLGEQAKKTGQHSETAGQGIGHVQRAMSALAFSATGTAGPVGHLANALLLFGAGSTLTIGIAAGLAVIAAGYQLITADARAAAKAHEDFVAKLNEMNVQKVPDQAKLADARLEVANAREALKTLQRNIAALPEAERPMDSGVAVLGVAQQRLRDAQQWVARLTPDARKEHKKAGDQAADEFLEGYKRRFAVATIPALSALITELQTRIAAGGAKAAEKFGPLLQQAVEEFAGATRASPHLQGIFSPGRVALAATRPFQAPAFGTGPGAVTQANQARITAQAAASQEYYTRTIAAARAILLRAASPQQIFNNNMAILQVALDEGAISVEDFDKGVKQLTGDMEKAKKGTQVLAASIVTAVAGAIAAIVSGGGAGGVLSGIGGIIGLIPGGQLAGAIIGGFGTVLSASESKGVTIDRYSQAALDQLKGIPAGPQRIELLIQSPTTGEIIDRVIYTLGERGRTDGVRRVPVFLQGR